MALDIRQQIKGVVRRAQDYWADLTDASGRRAQAHRAERDDTVHQSYGGVRGEDEGDAAPGRARPEASPDAAMPPPAARAARGGQTGQPGGQSRRSAPAPAGQTGSRPPGAGSGQTSRQYVQQGGSGIQKSLDEQLGGDHPAAPDRPAAPGASRGRGTPGQLS